MINVIDFYQKSRLFKDSQLEKQAEELLDIVLKGLSCEMPIELGNGLLGTACGIIYLLQHQYVDGDADEILAEVDHFLFWQLTCRPDEAIANWADWLYYFRIRILCNREPTNCLSEIIFRQNLIFLLDRLTNAIKSGYHFSRDIYSEVKNIHQMNIFPVRTATLLGLQTNTESLIPIDNIERDEVAFVVAIRIDSIDRERNLDFLLEKLTNIPNSKVWIIEGDDRPRYTFKHSYSNVYYLFKIDSDPVFYRTKYLNDMLKMVEAPIIGVWDTDIWVAEEQIQMAVDAIKKKKAVMSYPYDGRCCWLPPSDSNRFRENCSPETLNNYGIYRLNTNGGAFFVNRKTYLAAGGENELFYGWGPEDTERIKRMEILRLPVFRSPGPLFHLYHPRNDNSKYAEGDIEMHNRKMFLKICSLSAGELLNFIQKNGYDMRKLTDTFRKNEKYSSEIAFWKNEISRYKLWYEGKLSELYGTSSPLPEQCIVLENPIHSAIMTWTKLHQQIKYLQVLQLDSQIFSGKKVLDLGAGPMPSATCFSGCELYALDPLMSVYRDLGFPHELYPDVHFIEAYAEKQPFEDNFFDVVISVNAIDHIDSLELVGMELQRVCKPDCFFTMHVHYHSATVCEPIEISDILFKKVFNWVKNLRVVSRSQYSYGSVIPEWEQYVLWSNF